MVKIHSYWNYEDQPGVIVELNSGSFRGFLIPEGATEWEPQTHLEVIDWYEYGVKISKSNFENSFRKIGDQLPQLPPL
jgi:hypothetical protein